MSEILVLIMSAVTLCVGVLNGWVGVQVLREHNFVGGCAGLLGGCVTALCGAILLASALGSLL